MEITIEDGVDGGVIGDSTIRSSFPTYNFGGKNEILLESRGQIGSGLLKVDLSLLAGFTPVTSHFGLDLFSGTGIGLLWYQTIKDWNPGVSNGSALTGEVTWYSAKHNQLSWTIAGCRGEGTDRNAIADGSKTTVISSDFQIPISNDLAQIGIDNGELPIILINDISTLVRFRSTEATEGNKPYFYMEYTDGGDGWQSNSYYGNRRIASTNSPQRSRRTY